MVCLTPANGSLMAFGPPHALTGYHPVALNLWRHASYLWRNGKHPECLPITHIVLKATT